MTGAANGGPRLPRRSLLALSALAALPAAGCTRRSEYTGGTLPTAPSVSLDPAGGTAPSPSPSAAHGRDAAKRSALSGGAVKYVPGKVLLGSYLDLGGMSLPQALALRQKQLGRKQDIVHVFYKWTDAMPQTRPDIPDESTLMISWEGTFYSAITGGSSDKLIAAAARQLAKHEKPTLLRWGWEMNGNWFDWDGTHNGRKTAGYAKSWQRMRRIFHDEGADNVAWVWSPNWNSGPNVSWNQYEHYYPGDAYVDWVGVSAYPFNKQTPQTLFQRICTEYGARKPIMLAETASVDNGGNTKRDWINAFAAYLKAQPAIGSVVWFDTDTQPGTSENFRIDSNSSVLAAYKAMADSEHFSA
jgi:hypothetical protein